MSSPLVSVYLPTYNRINLLKRAVGSVLNQSYKHIELIVVDDGSTDGTLEYLYDISNNDGRVVIFDKRKSGKKQGAPASRNLAIIHSNGKFVTGLDDDDYFHKDRIYSFVNCYTPDMSCLASNLFSITKAGIRKNSVIGRRVSYKDLFDGNCLGPQIFVERNRIIDAGLFDEDLKASQDLDMWIRLTKVYGPALRIKSHLYYMDASHDHERISSSSSRDEGTRQFLEKYRNEMSREQIAYKLDSLGVSRVSGFKKLLKINDYGPKIAVNILRGKLRLS